MSDINKCLVNTFDMEDLEEDEEVPTGQNFENIFYKSIKEENASKLSNLDLKWICK